MRTIIYIILVIMILSACEGIYMDRTYPLRIKNNSTHSINAYSARMGFDFLYPDTLITFKHKDYLFNFPIDAGYTGTFISSSKEWKKELISLPKETLSIFIFHTDTLNKYPWEKVRDEYKILKRYDLSLQDLERLNYNVPYPPSPEMANMKMYPKYGK